MLYIRKQLIVYRLSWIIIRGGRLEIVATNFRINQICDIWLLKIAHQIENRRLSNCIPSNRIFFLRKLLELGTQLLKWNSLIKPAQDGGPNAPYSFSGFVFSWSHSVIIPNNWTWTMINLEKVLFFWMLLIYLIYRDSNQVINFRSHFKVVEVIQVIW